MSDKSESIAALEGDKARLLRELFEARGGDDTFM